MSRPLGRSEENVQREDFKLLIDPAIKKGHAKIYRYGGVFPGVSRANVYESALILHLVVHTSVEVF